MSDFKEIIELTDLEIVDLFKEYQPNFSRKIGDHIGFWGRINFIYTHSENQIDEIWDNYDYSEYIEMLGLRPYKLKTYNKYLLWSLIMLNEHTREKFNKDYNKKYFNHPPISDILDIYFYLDFWDKIEDLDKTQRPLLKLVKKGIKKYYKTKPIDTLKLKRKFLEIKKQRGYNV